MNRPAGGSASPAGTKTSSIPTAVSRATMSARCAPSRTSRADRCGTTVVAVRRPAACQRERRLQALGRRRGHRHGQVARHPLEHRLLGARPPGTPRTAAPASSGATRRQPAARHHAAAPISCAEAQRSSSARAGRADVDQSAAGRTSPPPLGLARQLGVPVLGQPDHPPVVPEVVRPQLRVPVQAELREHRPLEAADQEVGEQVGAGLGLEQRRDPVGARPSTS